MLSMRTFFELPLNYQPCCPGTICNPIWNVLLIYREDFEFFLLVPSLHQTLLQMLTCVSFGGVKVNRNWRGGVVSEWYHLWDSGGWWWFDSQRGRNRSWAVEFAHQRSSLAMTTISLISDLLALFNEWRMNDWARAGHPYPSELSCGARVKNRINVGLFRVDKERQSTMAEVGPGGRITSQAMWIVFAGPLFRLFSSGIEYIRIQWAKTGETKISVLWKIEISLMR